MAKNKPSVKLEIVEGRGAIKAQGVDISRDWDFLYSDETLQRVKSWRRAQFDRDPDFDLLADDHGPDTND